MKKQMLNFLLLSFSLMLGSCVGGDSASDIFGVKTAPDVNINLMAVNPSNKFLFTGESIQFSATGGSAPYSYTLSSGVGSVTPTGFYTAPAFAGTAIVRATDAKGEEAFATVSISIPIAISPTSSVIGEGDTINFSASGGLPPFTYRIVAGLGAINSTTGVYDATGVVNGSAVVEVKDSSENTAYASVTINPALVVTPQIATIGFSEQINFSTSGGNSPYTYTILSGGGTINSSSGVFVGPATVGTTIVRVTDSSSNTTDSVVTIVDKPQLDRPQQKVATNSTVTFNATNGAPPYTYSISSGGGSIVAATGVFTAPATTGNVVIQVTDFNGNTDSATIEVFKPRFIAMGYYHTCAIDFSSTTDSISKCWGRKSLDYSSSGLLGLDKNLLLLDEADEKTDYLPTINLGTGVQAKAVDVGYYSTCFVTTTNQLKCFGYNNSGNLGHGHRTAWGAKANHMGDNLPYTDLGTGRTVNSTIPIEDAISSMQHTRCIILDDNSLKCIGYNGNGKLGYGHTGNVGDHPSETGAYGNVDFGGTGVKDVAVGYFHSCAVLVTGDVKCWGHAGYGQTGLESGSTTGTSAGTKPVSLANVNLGTGRTATNVCTGQYHSCAILDTGEVKCWGRNTYGQLGQERTGDYGRNVGDMGDNLPVTQLGIGRTATSLACSYEATCALLDNGQVKCWGRNYEGQLGVGNTTNKGVNVGDMGDSLDPVILGSGLTATEISAGVRQFCAKLNTGAYKCWGDNPYATLAQGHRYDIGKSLLSMGDNLDPIQVSSTSNISALTINHLTGCAVLANGEAKCWGLDYYGTRGSGSRITGDAAGEMGSNLPAFNMGSNQDIKEMKSHVYTTCARTMDDKMFCFGQGAQGARASGNQNPGGVDASEWGDGIQFIDFGPVDTVKDFDVGYLSACAILTDNTVKCWGDANYGQLGLGNRTDRGDHVSELGANFLTTDLGNTSTPVQIASGYNHHCARFANGRVKCWGRNNAGQLGLGVSTGTSKGDGAGEMGNSLPYLNLGTGVNSTSVCAGIYHTCSLFDNGGVKCWGDRYRLGFGATSHIGDSAAEMGDNLPFLNFGTGRTAKKLSCGGYHACAILDNNELKCWGENGYGELGIGSTNDIGDTAGEMGDSHKAVNLGTDRYAVDVFTSLNQTCVVLDNNDIKCFGRNANGQLGQGHLTDIGEIDLTLGNNLPAVEIK